MIDSCRGQEKKEAICRKYYINPVLHLKLLKGQEKEGCCGKLTDQYYIFEYRPRGDYKSNPKHFFVGKDCAESFLKIIKHSPLPLFNPIRQLGLNNSEGQNQEGRESNKNTIPPFNKELINAINLLCIAWGTIPQKSFKKIIDFSKSSSQPNYKGLIWFNEILTKKDYLLRNFINDLKEQNDLREFPFTRLNQYLNEQGVTNGIG